MIIIIYLSFTKNQLFKLFMQNFQVFKMFVTFNFLEKNMFLLLSNEEQETIVLKLMCLNLLVAFDVKTIK